MDTRNTLDCDQSNVYSSRVIFSTISQDLPFRSFSLYRRSASYLPLSNVSNLYHYRLESEDIHPVNQIMRFRDLAIWSFSRWPPAAILDLIQLEMVPFDAPSAKTPPQNQHEGDRFMRCRVMGIWNFCKMCEQALRTEVARSSIFILLTLISYTPLSLR